MGPRFEINQMVMHIDSKSIGLVTAIYNLNVDSKPTYEVLLEGTSDVFLESELWEVK